MELVRRSRRYCRALAAGSADCNRICRDRLVRAGRGKIDHDSVSAAAEDLSAIRSLVVPLPSPRSRQRRCLARCTLQCLTGCNGSNPLR